MDHATIKDWLDLLKDYGVPLSTFIASLGGLWTLIEYGLKVKAEKRLANASEIEADLKLLTCFTEIMNIANARGKTEFSEKIFEQLLTAKSAKELELELDYVIEKSIIQHPIGAAAQDSAISAIWALGMRRELLRPVAIQALTSLSAFKPDVSTKYLEDLKARYKEKILASAEPVKKT